MGINLLHPTFNVRERSGIYDGINHEYASSALVVGLGNVLESFLASCIPDLHFEFFITHDQRFDFEVNTDGGNISVSEVILAEAGDKVGFTNPTVTNNDDFDQIVSFFSFHYGI